MNTIARLNASLADRYTIDHELGAGGMAVVYLARDLRHDRPVALKVLNRELAAVIVADIGIAFAVQQAGGERMTQTGMSLGTPQYMSPEQAMGQKTIDARTDIYALGAVLPGRSLRAPNILCNAVARIGSTDAI